MNTYAVEEIGSELNERSSEDALATGISLGVLRKGTVEDIQELYLLIQENLERILPRTKRDLLDNIGSFYVMEEAGKIVGCVCLEIYSHKICEIRTLIVKEGFHGKGYGKQLVEAALKEAQYRKIPQILAVSSALEFFQKLNFGSCLNEKFALFWNGNPDSAD